LTWALALAVLAHPLHSWIARRVHNPNVAAGLAVALVAIVLLVPTVFVVQTLVREVAAGMEAIAAQAESGEWQKAMDSDSRWGRTMRWLNERLDLEGQLQRALPAGGSRLPSILTGSLWTVAELAITLFALFFFFRDSRRGLAVIRSLLPLNDEEADAVFARVDDTIHATIYGTVVVALVQGFLGGLMFWWLGLPAPVLWGTVMALLSLIPYLGSFLIWGPTAAYLALRGDWGRALILFGWGAIIVGLIDNLLYPVLVGARLRMHTLAAFVAIVGGVVVFGASGLVLGPLVMAITMALIDIWRRRTAGGHTVEDGVAA
jgi:predicted PurR-regulated permease PerM